MRKLAVAIAAATLMGTMGASGGCGASTTGSGATGSTQAITYTIAGTSASSITYTSDGRGSQKQHSDITLPFTRTINVPAGFAFVFVTAENAGPGEISCKITREDGTLVKKATSSGQYAITSCSGSLTG